MKLWLVANPAAGSGKGERMGKAVAARLRERGMDIVLSWSLSPQHTQELTAKVAPDSFDGIVAVGGDGTFSMTVNALLRNHGQLPCPVGVVPLGTGNSLCRDLDIDSFDDALDAIAGGKRRPLDVVRYETPEGTGHFVNVMGVGFVAQVNARSSQYKALGPASYALSVILELARPTYPRTHLRIDDRETETNTLLLEVCNSRYTGGDMLIGPSARIDDGLFDLVVGGPMGRLRVLRALRDVFKGTHVDLPEVEVYQARTAEIATSPQNLLAPDGEVCGTTPVKMECLHHCLEVFA